jgi:hypothetical protein
VVPDPFSNTSFRRGDLCLDFWLTS